MSQIKPDLSMENTRNREYWRSLNQLADTPEFREFLHREFPEGASELPSSMNRRKFLTLMGASFAMAGLVACRRPVEKIVPYVKAPEEIIPGVPRYYATTMPLGTEAYGVVVENHDGRPTKIEGNELHPSSLGGTNVYLQAAILGMYDPDRSQSVTQKGSGREFTEFASFWQSIYPDILNAQGSGLAVLSLSSSSPTRRRMKQKYFEVFPQAKWFTWEPVSGESVREGITAATGGAFAPVYRFDRAKLILSLDADFLQSHESGNVVHSLGYADGRRLNSPEDGMNRMYVVESAFTITGGMADHRKRLSSAQMFPFLTALIRELGKHNVSVSGADALNLPSDFHFDENWMRVLAKDLAAHRGEGLVIAGRHLPPEVHALVFAVNSALKNTGRTVTFREPASEDHASYSDLADLTASIENGDVNTLVILDGNPVYSNPADIRFSEALERLEHSIHLSLYHNETSEQCDWHIPQAHFLESWGDARSADGTLSVIQPQIAPLFDGRSDIEMLEIIISGTQQTGYEMVLSTWKEILGQAGFESRWRRVLHDGLLAGSAMPEVMPALNGRALRGFLSERRNTSSPPSADNLEVQFRPSPALFDGRFANNGWLQELPDAVSKLAWDNAALISAPTAEALGVKNEDLIVLYKEDRELPLPVWILPGQTDHCVTVHLGYGRSAAGRIGSGVGFNAYRLMSSQGTGFEGGFKIRKTIETYPLANTQDHSSMEGRPIVREAELDGYRNNPTFAPDMVEHPPLKSLWKEHSYEEGYQWGMAIDLNACTGCNACTIACQSENNIPIVGKEQVKNGREMHWIRIDRYFSGAIDEPEMVHQPVNCQHCENAPCEQVCPVNATVHDSEGLNLMTYNRCIGTRYCSNNCPYKVRRFNFFNYTHEYPEIVHMAQNPDVTVRSRGVMEKCTYCLQRINEAKIDAKNNDRELKDGEVKTACQQACPTNAIVFGDINNPDSEVVRMKKMDRNYNMLQELNVKPRTSYLARIRNPNPELTES